jgi:cytochrome c
MCKANRLLKAIVTMAFIMASTSTLAQPADNEAIAKARKDYEAAMQGSDVSEQRIKKIQLDVQLAKAEKASNKSTATPAVIEMPQLARDLNCVACHAIDHKVVGPSWQDVANKYTGKGVTTYTYKGKEYPLIEGLVMKVSKGGNGNWGTMPMPPNDPNGTRKAQITELVKFEQSLAKK